MKIVSAISIPGDITFWVVTKPTDVSTLRDILFHTNIMGMMQQFKGGLTPEEIIRFFPYEERTKAERYAEKILKDSQEKSLNEPLKNTKFLPEKD